MCIFFCKEFYFEISGLNAEYYGQHFQKFHSPILIFSNSLLDTPALAINHHIALLLSNLEICQLAIATLSIVAVAPFFPFGHLNYIRGYMEVVWPVPPGHHHSYFAACLSALARMEAVKPTAPGVSKLHPHILRRNEDASRR